MAPRGSWFLAPRAPHFDCSPDGYIALGSFIGDPFEPEHPLAQEPSGLPLPLPPDIHIESAVKEDWEDVKKRRQAGRAGVWASWLQSVGLDDLGGDFDVKHEQAYKFGRLEINWFVPSPSFIRDRMEVESVAKYVGEAFLAPDIFIITAVMIARDPEVQQSNNRSWAIRTSAGAYLTAAGVPGVQVGADIGFSSIRANKTKSGASTDFVFAYRLSKIKYSRKNTPEGDRMVREKAFGKGAAFSNDGPRPEIVLIPQHVNGPRYLISHAGKNTPYSFLQTIVGDTGPPQCLSFASSRSSDMQGQSSVCDRARRHTLEGLVMIDGQKRQPIQ
jgi:hypothetical protein